MRSALYQVIDDDESVPIRALDDFKAAARATALIDALLPAPACLVAEEILVTNNHVFVGLDNTRPARRTDAAGGSVRFNFHRAPDGRLTPTVEYRLAPELFFSASQVLDYAFCGVESSPGKRWGYCRIDRAHADIHRGDDVFIIGHPDGGPKRISLAENTVEEVAPPWIRYTADTIPGSSGSPVFDRNAAFVAIHHGADSRRAPDGQDLLYNEGVLMRAILRWLPTSIRRGVTPRE